MSYEQPPRGRLARLFEAADRRHVPLRTILVTVGVVVADSRCLMVFCHFTFGGPREGRILVTPMTRRRKRAA